MSLTGYRFVFYRHVMKELLSTERTYVEELKAIVEVLMCDYK